jgi:integrase
MWLHKPKLNVLIETYLQKHKLAYSTARLTRTAWSQMVEEIGDIRVNKFTPNVAENIQSYWLRKVSSSAARVYRKSVSPVFSWAVTKRYIKKNPFGKLKAPKESKKVVRVYSPAEFRNLLIACGGDIRWITMLVVARTTGLRKSAIQNLTKDDIRWDDKVIVPQIKLDTDTTWPWMPKDRDERPLPLAESTARLLTDVLKTVQQPYIFLKTSRYFHLMELKKIGMLTGDMMLHPISNFDRKFRKIKKAAGVRGKFHDLRSTCLTDLSGVLNPNELKRISGHSDVQTLMRYIGIGRDTVNKARVRVNESLRALPAPSQALVPN